MLPSNEMLLKLVIIRPSSTNQKLVTFFQLSYFLDNVGNQKGNNIN